MNHWKTTESATNEAERIHFGGNVYVELHSLMAGLSLAAPRACGVGHRSLKSLQSEDLMAILFQAAPTQSQREGGREGGVEGGNGWQLDPSTWSVTQFSTD